MRDLLMQIQVKEKKLNRLIDYDDIVNIKLKNNILTIKDDVDWKTSFEINNDMEIKIEFYPMLPY